MKNHDHYIVYPDESWVDPFGYEQFPDGHRCKLDGATCIRAKDFKNGDRLTSTFWNPATLGKRLLAPMHFIVWRHTYKTGRTSSVAQDPGQFGSSVKHSPTHFEGAACIHAVSIAQAEEIALEDSLWEPVDRKEIETNRKTLGTLYEKARTHYPESW